MKIIYIVEKDRCHEVPSKGYVPNFTMPEDKKINNGSESNATFKEAAANAAKVGFLNTLPSSLVIAAAVASPLIYNYFKEGVQGAKEVEDVEKSEIEKFLANHAITESKAKELGYAFPPGHPQPGQAYKQHPLSELAKDKKKDVYIPYEKYDTLLMEERESELIRLLVELGATRIVITKNKLKNFLDAAKLSGDMDFSVTTAKVSGVKNKKNSQVSLEAREYILEGSDFTKGSKLDRSKFAWIDYEPSWESLVIARELGGCTKAELEIKENTSFSIDKAVVAQVKLNSYGGGVEVGNEQISNNDNSFVVRAEFK